MPSCHPLPSGFRKEEARQLPGRVPRREMLTKRASRF